jgi:YVTN family beta-propeller protein
MRWFILLLILLATVRFLPPMETGRSKTLAQPRLNSSSLAITVDGLYVLVANPESDTLSIIESETKSLVDEIPVGNNPQTVAISVDGARAYVTNKGSGTISVIDLETRREIEELSVGDQPVGITISPDGQFIAVAESGHDSVRFIHAGTLASLSVIPVGDRPYGLTYTPDGRKLLVTHLLSGAVTVIEVQPFQVFIPTLKDPPSGDEASAGQSISLGSGPQKTAVFTVTTWPHIAPAPSIFVNSTGTRAYIPQTMANGLGLNTQFDNTVFPKVSVLNLESWSHQSNEHIPLPETDRPIGLPWDVALSRNDTELWVVNSASNDVSVVDITNPTIPMRRAHITAGANPRGIAISPDGSTAYVNNTLSGTVSVIDTDLYTTTAVIEVTHIPLPPLLLNGKQLFHSSARPDLARASWISCNTCHIEQEHDGRTWLLQYMGEIPPGGTPVITRNTASLLGMIETYPLRWSAEWDESADSEFSIRFEQFGTGLIDGAMYPTLGLPNQGRSDDLDSLAAYLDSLVLPDREHNLSATELRGKMIFDSPATGCLDCHPPPLYTDLQRHDVGTAGAAGEWFGPEIDTPTLRFLYDSTPYLHDGSANTLLEVLTLKNQDDDHGLTSHLSVYEQINGQLLN